MIKLSTENLTLLPRPDTLQKLCKAISVLEAIICPQWEYRYYSYQNDWSETEEFCGMRDGQGDQMLILFSAAGVCINGFAHESEMNRKNTGVLENLPKMFEEFVYGEPVKSIGTTFCIWQTSADTEWQTSNIELPQNDYKDGSSDLLQLLDGKPITYKEWAEDYYEEEFEDRELSLSLVEQIYSGATITKEIVKEINPELQDFETLKSDLGTIGYDYRL